MKFNPDLLQSTLIDPDTFSLSELLEELYDISSTPDEKESKLLTAFYWKLMMPWLCLFAILAPAPFCMTFSRNFSIFLVYVCSLFGLIAFYMLMDAAQVIAKRQVLTPFWAICGPFLTTTSYFGWRFIKIDS
jgi:lipopolysaccharide export system permease protein